MTRQQICDLFKKSGIKPTQKKILIYEFLDNNKTHPAADVIFESLRKDNPFLSRTTVYSALKEFCAKGIVNYITIDDNKVLYDSDINEHGHFKCKNCGKIFDFKIDNISFSLLDGFEVFHKNLYFDGYCAACADKK